MKTKLLITCFIIATNAGAQYIKLFDFTNDSVSGSLPFGSLITDGAFLYGMTQLGGTEGVGTVFKIKQDGTEYSTLLNFSDSANGGLPMGSLFSSDNFLYGMTSVGLSNHPGGIFKIKPDGSGYSNLYDFLGNPDGESPRGSLVSDGTFLYGMTATGGTDSACSTPLTGCGTIFKIKPDGTGYSKLFDFSGSNGTEPQGDLIFDGTFLYGMTLRGGDTITCVYGCGVLFKIKPDGTEFSTLLDFNEEKGIFPYGSLIFDGTFIYGMTSSGGVSWAGTIFKIKPDGTEYSKLYDFLDEPDGASPRGTLVLKGNSLYGMTGTGGTNDLGVLFKIKADGTGYSVLYNFTTTDGAWPAGSLISDGTFLYGMTPFGGTHGQGVVFKIKVLSTGITDTGAETGFMLYPNPFSSSTMLKTDKVFKAATLIIYNVYGQSVKEIKNVSGNTITLDRDNLPAGLYFLRIEEGNKLFSTEKFVIVDNY